MIDPKSRSETAGLVAGVDTVVAVCDSLQQKANATMRKIVADDVYDHSLGYGIPQLEIGEGYLGG